MNEHIAGFISFLGYRLVKFEYECNPSFEFDSVANGKMQYNLSKLSTQLKDGATQVNLLTRVFFADSDSFDDAPMRMLIEIAGVFREANGEPWQTKWESNAVAILYPYIRALIGSLTAQSGRQPILLPTINVAAMFAESGEEKHD